MLRIRPFLAFFLGQRYQIHRKTLQASQSISKTSLPLVLLAEMYSSQNDNHQKYQPENAEQNELVLPDPVHHGLHQFTALAQIVPNPSYFPSILD